MKSIFHSKTFWVNIIALIALIIQTKYGWIVDESMQMQILAVINIILRYVTSEGIKEFRNSEDTTTTSEKNS